MDVRETREKKIKEDGYPAYTTQIGWIGYPLSKIETLCKDYLDKGFTAFKIKVGQSLEDDKKRCQLVRKIIGSNNLMVKILSINF